MDIYSLDEISTYFNGSSSERRTWPSIKYTDEEIFICYIRSKNDVTVEEQKEEERKESKMVIGGYAKWCYERGQKGELSSLYIDPKYWNLGCGSMLWDHIMLRCKEEFILSLDIWLLDKAKSKYFYISRGCHQSQEEHGKEGGKSGDYFIGHHKETALCYEMTFT